MTIRSSPALALAIFLTACGSAPTPPKACNPACPDGRICTDGQCVSPAPIEDAGVASGCSSDLDCRVGKLGRCDQSSGVCVECLSGADCVSGVCNPTHACAALPDACGSAIPLDLTNGLVTISSTTASAVDDVQPSCALGMGAPDLVYRIIVPQSGRLIARVSPADPAAYQPVAMISKSCPGSGNDELDCAYTSSKSQSAETALDVTAGEYFLWVDGDSGTAGGFTLSLRLEQPLKGDSCGNPFELDLSSGLAQVTGSTVGATTDAGTSAGNFRDDTFGSCGGTASDVVYSFTVTMPVRLQAEVTTLTQGYAPVVYLRRPGQCTSESGGAQLACATPGFPATTSKIDVPKLEPGTYSLFVDGDLFASSPNGQFQLKVQTSTALVTPTNDDCQSPIEISPPAGGVGIVNLTGDTTSALSDATSGACGGAGPDVVYQLHLTAPRQVIARVTPSSNSWTPVVYVRESGACGDGSASALLACNRASQNGGSTSVTVANLPAGDSFLWVDGIGNGAGPFSLQVEFAAPAPVPSNDTCSSPTPLLGSGGLYSAQGTTTGAADDAQTCTYPAGAFSADVVYQLDVPADSSVSVDVQAASGSQLSPVIQLRKPNACASDSLSDQVFCAWPDSADTTRATRVIGNLPAGQYFLWVDGDVTTHGAFQVKANLSTPVAAPGNDICNSAQQLLPNVPVIADTRSASNDGMGYCQGGDEASGALAPDVVFQFDNASTASRTITVVPDPYEGRLLRPVVYVRGPGASLCGSLAVSSQVACAAATSLGGTLTLSLPNLPAGTYSVWVDGAAQQSGRFTIKLQ